MAGIHINPSNLAVASIALPKDTQILMLSLLRFRETAIYPTSSDLPAISGKDACIHRYLPAFQSSAHSIDERIQPVYFGNVGAHVVGANDVSEETKTEDWHVVSLVRWPTFQVFREVMESERYKKEALPHRLAALEDWRFLATVELTSEQLLG